jgi:hypothetical protein
MGFKSLAVVCLALVASDQDPPEVFRPTAPPSRSNLPPVEEPFRTPVDRDDLIQRFDAPHPLQGTYELREVVRPGQTRTTGITGYLVICRRRFAATRSSTTDCR